ncbi:unnamed protein product [Echinostoma caproni]|uniref:SRCR domain-containing protein n=1 Tax=Echinostoma caproni TaxID=27848 RepID=A0A183A883_9TREM|nr:unnamed protein product [Echinostoma caproni]
MRWDLACDQQFSVEVGQVICQELGAPTMNAIVRSSHLLDYQLYGFENPLVTKHIWMESYVCQGLETSRSDCVRRWNYDFSRCSQVREYVFLRCALWPLLNGNNKNESIDRMLWSDTWGNLRIIRLDSDLGESDEQNQSVLEHVHFERAGLLHGQRVPALMSIRTNPKLSYIRIDDCLGSGISLIDASGFVDVTNSTIRGCLGRAIEVVQLNGDSTDPTTVGLEKTKNFDSHIPRLPPRQGSLLPEPRPTPEQTGNANGPSAENARLPLPFYPMEADEQHTPGFVSMCAGEKWIPVIDRVLIIYRYSWYQAHSCTKLFRSVVPGRRLAWRFLAVNLYEDPIFPNGIELYNGAQFNTTYRIAVINAASLTNRTRSVDERYTVITSPIHDLLGVRMHSSPASHMFGFIAEVITLPLSPVKPYHHRIESCDFLENQGGAVRILTVGEAGPRVKLAHLRLERNGLDVLNLTGPVGIDLRLSNTPRLSLTNCLIGHHKGDAIRIALYAGQLTRGTQGNITNNVILRNHFNQLQIRRNYIAHNNCGARDLISLVGVLVQPFAHNFVHDNRADVLLNVTNQEGLSRGSLFEYNGFYKNEATNYTRRTTVFVGTSKNTFRDNYFKNPLNDYELSVGNRSVMRRLPIQPGTRCPQPDDTCPHGWTLRLDFDACFCYRPDPVDAQRNWWGDTYTNVQLQQQHQQQAISKNRRSAQDLAAEQLSNRLIQSFARSRIFDWEDDAYLMSVDYAQAYADNSSVLGPGMHCPPTWSFLNYNCFFYFGAPMTYREAHDFCLNEVGGVLAKLSLPSRRKRSDPCIELRRDGLWTRAVSHSIRSGGSFHPSSQLPSVGSETICASTQAPMAGLPTSDLS